LLCRRRKKGRREKEESKIAMKVAEQEKEAKNEFDYSSTESSKGGNESSFSPDQSEDEDFSKCLSVLCYPIFTCP
jgi:hypothetical protein